MPLYDGKYLESCSFGAKILWLVITRNSLATVKWCKVQVSWLELGRSTPIKLLPFWKAAQQHALQILTLLTLLSLFCKFKADNMDADSEFHKDDLDLTSINHQIKLI